MRRMPAYTLKVGHYERISRKWRDMSLFTTDTRNRKILWYILLCRHYIEMHLWNFIVHAKSSNDDFHSCRFIFKNYDTKLRLNKRLWYLSLPKWYRDISRYYLNGPILAYIMKCLCVCDYIQYWGRNWRYKSIAACLPLYITRRST